MKFINKICQCDLGYTGVECGSLINLCDVDNPCPNPDFNDCLPFKNGYTCLPSNSFGQCLRVDNVINCVLQDYEK